MGLQGVFLVPEQELVEDDGDDRGFLLLPIGKCSPVVDLFEAKGYGAQAGTGRLRPGITARCGREY